MFKNSFREHDWKLQIKNALKIPASTFYRPKDDVLLPHSPNPLVTDRAPVTVGQHALVK